MREQMHSDPPPGALVEFQQQSIESSDGENGRNEGADKNKQKRVGLRGPQNLMRSPYYVARYY